MKTAHTIRLTLAAATAALFAVSIPSDSTAQGTGSNNQQQATSTVDDIPQKFWIANLPGGEYMVALGRITNIAIHEYIANKSARVYEVAVAAEGSLLARFYYMEPVTDKSPLNVGQVVADRLKSSAEEIGRRTGMGDQWKKVVKDYPTTTHAGTVEFRLDYKDDLDKIYQSVKGAWLSGRGKRITVTNG